jgi:Xaa-Pro aminopeptidase
LFSNDVECDKFLSEYDSELVVDKSSINAHDYALIKKPVHKPSKIKLMKSVKSDIELDAYKYAFERTDKTLMAIRDYIENNDNLSEYDIAVKLREEYIKNGAKNLSFNPIVAINQHSAQAHYSKSSKETILHDGDLVLIDSGAYYESGLATDITRVFVKGEPTYQHKKIYTNVLKAFLNAFNYLKTHQQMPVTGYDIDKSVHDFFNSQDLDGFIFNHGLGHGIGINAHEYPPKLSTHEISKVPLLDGECFSIEPGLYKENEFGVRLENSCYYKNGEIHSFVKMNYEDKLIDYSLLSETEIQWLKEFEVK